jgi:hypothetical protein
MAQSLAALQALFDHFVETLQQACDIMQLGTGAKDYRRLALSSQVTTAAQCCNSLQCRGWFCPTACTTNWAAPL